MKKSCKYCGRVHDERAPCPCRPSGKKAYDDFARFRGSRAWKHMREAVMERDGFLCRVCADSDVLTKDRFVRDRLSVHHIVPLAEDFSRGLDADNLITLCASCHEKAEKGEIGRDKLRRLAARRWLDPPRCE